MLGKEKTDTEFWLRIRQAILGIVDAIEWKWGFSPTTAEIRRKERERRKQTK